MNRIIFILLLLFSLKSVFSQTIVKPTGCFAGTNGTNSAVLSHTSARGVLLTEKWSDIEPTPGVYIFTSLNNKINAVTSAGLKYSLAIPAGAFGSPSWLIDSLNASFHSFQYQSQTWKLPLWWDTICMQKLTSLINQIGNQYASDTMLSHVYVTQMTSNGVEGHLNGVNMTAFANDGFTNQKWITSAKTTTKAFANAFLNKPIVFEVHEIGNDTLVPSTIINDLANDSALCNRLGLGMWWISGKTSYQSNLVDFINNFPGDKYAQVIGRSDQPERFKDSLYSSVFSQAKNLNIRYIEPWPYEFQHNTFDSLIHNFNLWADSNFSSTDSCSSLNTTQQTLITIRKPIIYPNPTNNVLFYKIEQSYKNIQTIIIDLKGQVVINTVNNETEIDLKHLNKGLYILKIKIDNKTFHKKIIKN